MEFAENNLFGLVFGQIQHFRIPDFQRSFSWKKDMWETLWVDIINQYKIVHDLHAERLSESDIHQALQNRPTHYLGAVVTTLGNSMIPPSSDVLDGQQRLLTSSIIYLAIRDTILKNLGTGESTEDLVHNIKDTFKPAFFNNVGSEKTKFRLLTQDVDKGAWEYLLSSTRPIGLVTRASFSLPSGQSDKIIQAFNYFYKEMNRDNLDQSNSIELKFAEHLFPLDIERLKLVVETRLRLVRLACDRNDDANAIFESLNAKSEALKQVDLIKNYIYISLPTDEASEVYKQSWKPMEYTVGSDRIERFVWAVVVSQGNTTSQNRTYETVRHLLSGKEPGNIRKWVESLAVEAKYFKCIVEPSTEIEINVKEALISAQRAGGVTMEPLILFAYRAWKHEKATEDQLVETIQSIESYLVRRMIAAEKTQVLNPLVTSMINKLHAKDGEYEATGDLLDDIRRVLSAPESVWSDSDQVLRGLRLSNFYKSQKTDQRQHILQSIDMHLNRRNSHNVLPNYENSDKSIEHIIPQTPTIEWNVKSGENYPGEILERIHSLSNLTLLPSAVNASLGNSPWLTKREAYSKSGYYITKQIFYNWGEGSNWGINELDGRSAELLKIIELLWPKITVPPRFIKEVKPKSKAIEMVNEFEQESDPILIDEE